MDYFALYHQEAWNLKHKIIDAISEVLKEKGYAPGGVNGGTLVKGTLSGFLTAFSSMAGTLRVAQLTSSLKLSETLITPFLIFNKTNPILRDFQKSKNRRECLERNLTSLLSGYFSKTTKYV